MAKHQTTRFSCDYCPKEVESTFVPVGWGILTILEYNGIKYEFHLCTDCISLLKKPR